MNITPVLNNNIKFYTTAELKNRSVSYYKLQKLVAAGKLSKLSPRVYENTEYSGEESDFAFAPIFIPNGVVCLLSAAIHYNLTTCRPTEINIAIERTCKPSTLPQWPPIGITYFSKKRFETGKSSASIGNLEFAIYDIEKTVIDIIYYRNKIGIEETREILKNYLSRPDRNLNTLYRYAAQLNCAKILNTYLEVLL